MVSDQPLGILEPSENRPQPTGSVEVLGHMSTKKMLSQQQISNFLCSLSVAFAATGRSIRSHRALPMSRWHSQPPGAALSSPVLLSFPLCPEQRSATLFLSFFPVQRSAPFSLALSHAMKWSFFTRSFRAAKRRTSRGFQDFVGTATLLLPLSHACAPTRGVVEGCSTRCSVNGTALAPELLQRCRRCLRLFKRSLRNPRSKFKTF